MKPAFDDRYDERHPSYMVEVLRRQRNPERDLEVDPADEDARRWERELSRPDVSRRDP